MLICWGCKVGLFAEVFDTTRVAPAEIAAAQTILMVGALKPEPCELASIHAINSKFILDECRSDVFYRLVREGRVRFRRRRNELGLIESPREDLIRRMGQERYFNLAWPETFDSDSGTILQGRCADVVKALKNQRVYFNCDSLQSRVEAAKELFAAIDASPVYEEKPRPVFRDTVLAAIPRIPSGPDYVGLRELIQSIVASGRIAGRSQAYFEIEKSHEPDRTKELARDFFDECYNRDVARSLEAEFFSSRRLLDLDRHREPGSSSIWSRISYAQSNEFSCEHLDQLISQPISWEIIGRALGNLNELGPNKLKAAREMVLGDLGRSDGPVPETKRNAIRVIFAASTVVASAVQCYLAFDGGIGGWIAVDILLCAAVAPVVYDLTGKAETLAKKERDERNRVSLNGWLDSYGHDDRT